jgi:hypothetical protein
MTRRTGRPAAHATIRFYKFALTRFLEWAEARWRVQVYEVFRVGGGALRGLWRVWCGRLAWEWGRVGPLPPRLGRFSCWLRLHARDRVGGVRIPWLRRAQCPSSRLDSHASGLRLVPPGVGVILAPEVTRVVSIVINLVEAAGRTMGVLRGLKDGRVGGALIAGAPGRVATEADVERVSPSGGIFTLLRARPRQDGGGDSGHEKRIRRPPRGRRIPCAAVSGKGRDVRTTRWPSGRSLPSPRNTVHASAQAPYR